MITVSVNQASLDGLRRALSGTKRKLERELATAINATARKVRLEAARDLRQQMAVPVKVLKKVIKGKSKAKPGQLYAVIGFFRGYPIPLKYFKATQTKKGVTYKINPKVKVKSIVRDAFIVKQYGGNVYKRKTEKRFPLEKQFGPAPGDFFEKAGILARATKLAETELEKQIKRRIRFIELKKSGDI